MPRYNGESPFDSSGLVWVNGSGFVISSDRVHPITEKPDLSFDFDSLYAEPTLCHYVLDGSEYPLDEGQIDEVSDFIQAYSVGEVSLARGVDADGKLIENASPSEIVRHVVSSPPGSGTWRLDMSNDTFEFWIEQACVDADGRYLGSVNEGEWHELASSKPPSDEDYWRWINGGWIDARPDTEKLAFEQRKKLDSAWQVCVMMSEQSTCIAEAGEQILEFSSDKEARDNILGIFVAIGAGIPIPDPYPWYPKGATEPELMTRTELAALGAAMLARKQEFMSAYFSHKTAIKSLSSIEAVQAYDISTGWPS